MKQIGIMIFAALLIISCSKGEETLDYTGTLRVQVGEAQTMQVRGLPDISNASYRLTGSGPEGQDFVSDFFDDSELVLSSMHIGAWEVVLTGYDQAQHPVSQDRTTLAIHRGEETCWEALLTPLEGTGTLDVTVNWPEELPEGSSQQVQITSASGGEAVELDMLPGGGSQQFELDQGYYLMQVAITHESTSYYGEVFLLRILAEQETTFTLDLTKNDLNYVGSVSIEVDEYLGNPLEVHLDGPEGDVHAGFGNYANFTAGTPEELPEGARYQFRWFVNGEDLGKPLEGTMLNTPVGDPGILRVTVILRCYDEQTDVLLRAGASAMTIHVLEEE